MTIKDLFANDISRRIEEVIKVDQADEQIIRDELAEYVVTDSIRGHLTEVLESYWETPNKPHEGVAIWVSGFFGSGKSSFAKYLGLGLQNRTIGGVGAAKLLAKRIGDAKAEVLLSNIAEQIPTEAVIFDVSTDRGIRTEQPEHHRDHVPTLSAEPRVCPRSRPVGARDHPGGSRVVLTPSRPSTRRRSTRIGTSARG